MKIIYKVTEDKNYNPEEIFFEKEEDARRWMKNKANSHLHKAGREDLFVSVDLPRHLHLRFGDPDGDNGLFMMLDMDEIIVH